MLSSISLSEKTWFRTGGIAQWYSEPCTVQEFQQVVYQAASDALPITMLGDGANVLVSDEGIAGVVIHPLISHVYHERVADHIMHVTVGAGLAFSDLIRYCLDHQLIGLEEFSGIPGTVGGSVFINIHYFQWLLSNFLVKAQVIDRTTGAVATVDNAWFNFGYNRSRLQEGTHYLAEATFTTILVTEEEAMYARGRSDEIIRHRRQRYPRERTCGSFFRNFTMEEIVQARCAKPVPYVAYYIEQLGVKGQLSVGGAILSHQHANMIITQPGAMSNDVVSLARIIQQLVYERYGLWPEPECRLLGFSCNPLIAPERATQIF